MKKKVSHVVVGFFAGVIFLVILMVLRGRNGDPFSLPYKFFLIPLAPIIAGFITGGYFKKVKAGFISAEMENFPDAPQSSAVAVKTPLVFGDWRDERAKKYDGVDHYMLTHVYRPSATPEQKFDIFLFLVRHQKGTETPPSKHFEEIAHVEFFFGDSWGNKVFTVNNSGGVIGVRTRAWGTFLATCRISFKDSRREPIILFRYVDFHMLQDNPQAD
jgi:hypothetical protein